MKESKKIARSALLIALALVMLYLSSMVPRGNLGVVALAGVVSGVAVVVEGRRAGVLCYIGISLLAAILVPNKGNVLLFILFFGCYPIVKSMIEGMGRLVLEWGTKLIFFNGMSLVIWAILGELFLVYLPHGEEAEWAIVLGCNVAFVIYDFGLTRLIGSFGRRISPHIK